MRFLPPDEDVELYKQGFDADILNRVKAGKALSELLERIEDPLVVALDGRWGTGKTYFLKRWVGAHTLQNEGKATTVYFDAFAHDYLSDPLVALVSALSERMPRTRQTRLKRVQTAAAKFAKPITRMGLAAATFGASEALNDLGDVLAESISVDVDRAIEEFWKREEGRRAAMAEFRSALESLTASTRADRPAKPLIIVIDELDRCRPDYALELLEVIKHFFAVDHVHFVLGVNLDSLENSVRVRYGAQIDAAAYLKKFISLSLGLPETMGDHDDTKSILTFARYIAEQMKLPKLITGAVIDHLKVVSEQNFISVRDVGKIMSAVSLLPIQPREQELYPGWREVLITLVVSKVVNPNLYGKFLSGTATDAEIESHFGSTENRRSDRSNEDYDHASSVRFWYWSYVCRDGKVDWTERDSIARQFDTFGRHRNPRGIPKTVHRQWLDIFSMTN